MEEIKPSIDDWKSLYEVAIEFKKLECWNWMSDSDIFGIQNPYDNEIGYCCVLGKNEEFFGLVVYIGTEGLKAYLMVKEGEFSPGSIESLIAQKCLTISYEDRQVLTDKDRDVIKELGLKFRGRKEWPFFRTYDPGYHPWYLNKTQVLYLTLVIQKAIEIAIEFKKDSKYLGSKEGNKVPVWIPKKTDSDWTWENKLVEVKIPRGIVMVFAELEKVAVDHIKSVIKGKGNPWEIDSIVVPIAMSEKMGDRPFYPYMLFVADSDSQLVLGTGMSDFWDHSSELVDIFISTIEKLQILPSEIYVRSQEVYELLRVVAEQLGIKITPKNDLPAIEKILSSTMDRLF